VIDAGIPDEWPDEVLRSVGRFRQGHLVERPPIFYAAAPRMGIWDLTRNAGDPNSAEDLIEIADNDRPDYGLITTQTCDLAEEGRPDQPWFQVAPVYRLENLSAEDMELLKAHRKSSYVLLDPPALDDGAWIVDLRIEVPLEKGWLVGREPIEAFGSEEAYAILGNRLAARRDRPAIATAAMNTVVRPLANWVRGKAGLREAGRVDELRLAVGPSPLQVERASLLILTRDEPLPDDARIPWDRWWQRTQPRAAEQGIDLIANQYESLETLSARAYRNSIALDFTYLSRGV
jgi:hypothetical protein